MEDGISDDGPDLDQAILVALGSNLAGAYAAPEALLEEVLRRFPDVAIKVTSRSRWWRSQAWPDRAAPSFTNGVVRVATELGPRALIARLQDLEVRFGRVRGVTNAPRTLDLDLIAFGRTILNDERLILPHPRAHERRFVMGPLAEIAPNWRHPTLGLSARELAAAAGIGRDATPIDL